jgi:hypothetical protein
LSSPSIPRLHFHAGVRLDSVPFASAGWDAMPRPRPGLRRGRGSPSTRAAPARSHTTHDPFNLISLCLTHPLLCPPPRAARAPRSVTASRPEYRWLSDAHKPPGQRLPRVPPPLPPPPPTQSTFPVRVDTKLGLCCTASLTDPTRNPPHADSPQPGPASAPAPPGLAPEPMGLAPSQMGLASSTPAASAPATATADNDNADDNADAEMAHASEPAASAPAAAPAAAPLAAVSPPPSMPPPPLTSARKVPPPPLARSSTKELMSAAAALAAAATDIDDGGLRTMTTATTTTTTDDNGFDDDADYAFEAGAFTLVHFSADTHKTPYTF